jgi:DNA replication protein DnaC
LDHPRIEERRDVRYWYTRAGVPRQHQTTDWGTYELLADEHESLVDLCRSQVDRWSSGSTRGVALFGPPGIGKTMLTSIMACNVIRPAVPTRIDKLFSGWKPPVRYISLGQISKMIQDGMELERWIRMSPDEFPLAAKKWGENYEDREWVYNCPNLVIDDVGRERATHFSTANFADLIRTRWEKGRVTSLTSNLSIVDFENIYGRGSTSFVHEACRVEGVIIPDYRRRKNGLGVSSRT